MPSASILDRHFALPGKKVQLRRRCRGRTIEISTGCNSPMLLAATRLQQNLKRREGKNFSGNTCTDKQGQGGSEDTCNSRLQSPDPFTGPNYNYNYNNIPMTITYQKKERIWKCHILFVSFLIIFLKRVNDFCNINMFI